MKVTSEPIRLASQGMLMAANVTGSETQLEHAAVLLAALQKFAERNAKYNDLWQDDSPEELLDQLRSKYRRIQKLVEGETQFDPEDVELLEDSVLDLINYGVFILRQVKAEV